MCRICVKHVLKLSKSCGLLSTIHSHQQRSIQQPANNSPVLRFLSNIHPLAFPQRKLLFLPLFEQVFYPVSTAPIIMKMRLKRKELYI